jgi:tRNA-modifying protein YgfZ
LAPCRMGADDNGRMNAPLASSTLPDGALRLADWGLIRASGADARSFLHGQLTQDMQHLPQGQARLAGYCSAKGRLLASFVVWPAADDELLLACSADLLPAVLKRLSMFVLRAKCKLADASGELALWGLAGLAARASAQGLAPWGVGSTGGRQVVRLPDAAGDAAGDGLSVPRALLVQPVAEPAPDAPALGAAVWAALEARSGVVRIVAATAEQFVPQMVNLELVGGVNFQKGCYPGQEVVARSQYRGTLKRRAYLLSAGVPLSPGQEVFHSADPTQPAGLVALAGSLAPGRHDALVELKIAATSEGSLHLGAGDGPVLSLGALPYPLPAEAAA